MAEITRSLEIPLSLVGQRLDVALAGLLPEFSRSRLSQWIKDGSLTIDGASSKPREPVRGGERVELRTSTVDLVTAQAQAVEFAVLYEDAEVFVLNKPAGLVVHPGAGNPDQTLLNGLLHLDPELKSVPRAGLVHRLDKDTTGALVVARTLESHTALVAQLAEREVGREYLAVANGVPVAGGLIEVPIGRHPHDRLKFHADEFGRPSLTHFRVKERYRAHSLLTLKLETGRTHQIRVHLQYAGFPIVGDQLYGGRFKRPKGISADALAVLLGFKRQALHAFRLSFTHPRSGKDISVEAPLPDDLKALIAVLRADARGLDD
jgi:23S rRNA pseudouridine1911/1915/1917 synthase